MSREGRGGFMFRRDERMETAPDQRANCVFDQTIRHLLRLYPRGATDAQLIWRLGAWGLRLSASELLSGLSELAERGEIIRSPSGRWQNVAPQQSSSNPDPDRSASGTPDGTVLYAVRATWDPLPQISGSDERADKRESGEPGSPRLPPWPRLARYYAATQRKDPRGTIAEFSDRHGQCWQLLQMRGAWWDDTVLRVPMPNLPERLRESVSRRGAIPAAIGWPISIFREASGLEISPALLVPVEFAVEGDTLKIEVRRAEPAANPGWLRKTCRRAGMTQDELLSNLSSEGGESGLGAIGSRLRHTLARQGGARLQPGSLEGEIRLDQEGLHNVAALFLPEDATFTRGVARDLETLATWRDENMSRTALASFHEQSVAPSTQTVVALDGSKDRLLTENQRRAAQLALDGPLTVIHGPPGTGKSEVILAIVFSAVMAGRSVVVASRNHQAINELEARLSELIPDCPILTRARDAEGERDTSFADALQEIARGQPRTLASGPTVRRLSDLLLAAGALAARRRALVERVAIDLELSALIDQQRAIPEVLAPRLPEASASRFWHLVAEILRRILGGAPGGGADRSLAAQIRRLQGKRASIPDEDSRSIGQAAEELAQSLSAIAPDWARCVTAPDDPTLQNIIRRAREFSFSGADFRKMSEADARLVLEHRPIWAVSTLSVPARIPLIEGLFDYVVFDEASQCDIASALPLMARARQAVVVGDPLQLSFVPTLSRLAERALMDATGLPSTGRAQIAQSINSLFDFCEVLPGAHKIFLSDQFRSSPEIVNYLNDEFYGNKLVGRRDAADLRTPNSYRSGLAWLDVAGHGKAGADGPSNPAEADAILERLRAFAADPAFSGSVGVISPFNAQIGLIEALCSKGLSTLERKKLQLRIATVDKFQGGEADVVLFSLVVTPTTPQTSKTFLQRERRRFNVAVSRARALCIVVGDLAFARTCGIRHISYLAARATTPSQRDRPQLFDSVWERRLDAAMRARGMEPIPQYNVGWRYLDFALDPHGRKINVEVDGRRWHTDAAGNRKVADHLRDRELWARGWTIVRLWVHELNSDMEGCLDRIEHALGRR